MAVRFVFVPGRGQSERFAAIERRLKAPTGGPCGLVLTEQVMRRGRGSIDHQFAATATMDERGAVIPWPPTKAFGSRLPGPSTLVQTGRYRAAWMGGSGNIRRLGPRSVVVGVEPKAFPQVRVFQKAPGRVTVIRPRKSTVRTRGTAMRAFLGMTYGVWLFEERLLKGLRVPSRPIRVNPAMRSRALATVRSYLLTGTPTPPGEGIA